MTKSPEKRLTEDRANANESGPFSASLDGRVFTGFYASREEAVMVLRSVRLDEATRVAVEAAGTMTVWTGRAVPLDFESTLCTHGAARLFDLCSEHFAEEIGAGYVEPWLESVTPEEEADLGEALAKAWREWLAAHPRLALDADVRAVRSVIKHTVQLGREPS
jgi:hypothetical protein